MAVSLVGAISVACAQVRWLASSTIVHKTQDAQEELQGYAVH